MNRPSLPTLFATTTLALLAAVSAPAAAQDAQNLTVVLLPAPSELSDLPALYYDTLFAQVAFHPGYIVNDVREQSLDDLLLAVGCSVLDEECARTLGEVLSSELLIAGGFYAENGAVSVRLDVIDLATGQTVRSRSHDFRDDGAALRQYAALFSRSILYGNDASLTVETAPEGATVYVNDVESGVSPVTLSDLPLGLYAVRVQSDGYTARTDVVVVDRGSNEHDVRLSTAAIARQAREPRVPRERPERDGNPGQGMRIAGIGTAAAGVALLGAGLGIGAAKNGTQQEFDDLTSLPTFDRGEAESLREQGQSQASSATALMIAGGVLTAGGAVLTVLSFGRQERAGDVALDLGFNRVQLRLAF